VAHLYNLRQRKGYQRHRQLWTKTRPVAPNTSTGHVAELLNKLLIEEHTKSRSRNSNEMPRPNQRTARSCANTSDTAIFRSASPA
jgi:hypothetical protein